MAAASLETSKRVDLHCHSIASTEADEAVLLALQCPESYSLPQQVYAQAKLRNMDFVVLTDHDVITGAKSLADNPAKFPGVIVGEELTCYFPEDGCKMHVLVWGLNQEDHDLLQANAQDIYRCAEIIEERNLAHAVAHPLYRQNDKLERWHLERLVLMFKGFECLNGAHSPLHRDAFEPVLDELDETTIEEMARRHGLTPRWPQSWIKARTGGSDDHGLFNIGRTWTEFPGDVRSAEDVLQALRTARCRPGGEAGSSLKLAHNFLSVGIRYYQQNMSPAKKNQSSMHSMLLETLIGQRSRLRKRDVIKASLRRVLVNPLSLCRRKKSGGGAGLVGGLAMRSFRGRIAGHPALGRAMQRGLAPLGEHEEVFRLISGMNRDIAGGIVDSVQASLKGGQLGGLFDAFSAVAAQQFLLLPYYFALFHQNRERRHLPRITGHGKCGDKSAMRIGLFTDTFDQINGVSRFVRDMAAQARQRELHLTVHTCSAEPKIEAEYRKNFQPLLERGFPQYPEIPLALPPIAEVMEWADRQQFDAIHVDTPGPMGLCGCLVAAMLRIPLLGTYHTDFPAYVKRYTGDHRLTSATASYMSWFYGRMERVLSRSREYQGKLVELGVAEDRLALAPPGFNAEIFSPKHRDTEYWTRHGVREPLKLLYCGRISLEKNLGMLAKAFADLCRRRSDAALIIAGDGPYAAELQSQLKGLPAYFLGYQNDRQLGPIYASSDLFVFPSRTDTMGQVVIEAQASGLPVLVGNEGGPREVMDHDVTGLVLDPGDPAVWADAMDSLLSDEPSRQRMSRTAPQRMSRYSAAKSFEAFWEEHWSAVLRAQKAETGEKNKEAPPVLVG